MIHTILLHVTIKTIQLQLMSGTMISYFPGFLLTLKAGLFEGTILRGVNFVHFTYISRRTNPVLT